MPLFLLWDSGAQALDLTVPGEPAVRCSPSACRLLVCVSRAEMIRTRSSRDRGEGGRRKPAHLSWCTRFGSVVLWEEEKLGKFASAASNSCLSQSCFLTCRPRDVSLSLLSARVLFPFETVSNVFYQNQMKFFFQCAKFELQKNPAVLRSETLTCF